MLLFLKTIVELREQVQSSESISEDLDYIKERISNEANPFYSLSESSTFKAQLDTVSRIALCEAEYNRVQSPHRDALLTYRQARHLYKGSKAQFIKSLKEYLSIISLDWWTNADLRKVNFWLSINFPVFFI